VALGLFSKRKSYEQAPVPVAPKPAADSGYRPAPLERLSNDPFEALWQQQRYQIIARDSQKFANHPDGPKRWRGAIAKLQDSFALVPAGRVSLPQTLVDEPGAPEQEIETEPFLLDVHTVTNGGYQKFVDAGGYENLDIWPQSIWPHLIEFRDQTGTYGPRYWRDGRHDARYTNHPVIGVSWYEALAFCSWVGCRLPTEAEWQMAATWRIKSETDILRRFPWGDAMDRTRCNIWATGLAQTAEVAAFGAGAAPNGVKQLVGNVWEWVQDDLAVTTLEGAPVLAETAIKGTRGGAFDTFFESQATSLFRTGHLALARAHNVGFRCALSLSEAPWLNEDTA
jgi:iron(II)-dependent oxidoreductase